MDIANLKQQLLAHNQSLIDGRTITTRDLAIDFLVNNIDDDLFCEQLLRAILGDTVSAKYITNICNKHIKDAYEDKRL